jgi:hypothetical protein
MIFVILLLALAGIVFGADWLVGGSVSIAKRLRVSEFVIGAAIVGIGTSMPELIVSTLGAVKGNSDVAIGNVVGSNIFNILGILGVTALICPIPIDRKNMKFEIPLCILVSALLLLMAMNFFNGTAPAPYYWVNTIASLRVYRCDISASVNGDGSLKTATLEEAVALNATTTTQLPRLQTINAQGGYTGFYTDINTNGNGFIRYRENGGDRYDLATTAYDDYNGAYCYVMQAYDKQTMELVWIRSEYFRLSDVKADSAQ